MNWPGRKLLGQFVWLSYHERGYTVILDVSKFKADAQELVDLVGEVLADEAMTNPTDEVSTVRVFHVVLFTNGMGIMEGYARCLDDDSNFYGAKAVVGDDGLEDIEWIDYFDVGAVRPHGGLMRLCFNVLDDEVRHGWQAD